MLDSYFVYADMFDYLRKNNVPERVAIVAICEQIEGQGYHAFLTDESGLITYNIEVFMDRFYEDR